jgi:hypothetical protein
MNNSLILLNSTNQKQKFIKYKNIKTILKIIIFFIIIILLFNNYYLCIFRKFILNYDRNKIVINKKSNPKIQLNKKEIKVCICTIGKQENKYIKEFVEYYEKYGIDKIFLYDNNEKEGEHFEEVIKDYIDKGFVQITNWRGIKLPGKKALKECYMNNNKRFDWLIFYDIDEYIHLKNISNIKEFLNDKKFILCNKIYLNWVFHTDNNLLKYDNRSLHERFPESEPNSLKKNKNYYGTGKTIIRGRINNINIKEVHLLDEKIPSCNSYGKIINFTRKNHMKNLDFENYYIDHYYFKSLEEFIQKIKKGDTYFGHDKNFLKHRLRRYLRINKITL